MIKKYAIILQLETKEDHEALLKALEKHSTITWKNDSITANITREKETAIFKISKSTIKLPQRLRL